MKRFFGILIQSIVMGSLLGCSLLPTGAPAPAVMPTPCAARAITLGEISDDPVEVINSTQPFVSYLAEHLTAFGIVCGNVKVANNVDQMISAIDKGEVDIYFDSMFPATLVSDATGAQPILRRWRNCDPYYYSVIFTTADSGIASIQDLPGHMIAMDRPDSTSGMVLPAAYLIDHGLNLVVKNTYDEPVARDEVGITFTYDDPNTLALVRAGEVSAGATDDYHFSEWELEFPGELVLLGNTESALRQVVLLRPGLESGLQVAIKETLLQAHLDPEAVALLEQAVGTCKFDDVPQEIEASLEEMRVWHAKMQAIPGWPEALQEVH
jgi:phosphonate transport system substrate-binding protein